MKSSFKNKKGIPTINVRDTQYEVVAEAAKLLNFQISKLVDNSEIYWTDSAVTAKFVKSLKPFQKVNHYPDMHVLSRKDQLCINLNPFCNKFHDYDFVPKTWLLPDSHDDVANYIKNQNQKTTLIAKPYDAAQGKGIQIFQSADQIPQGEYVVQKYIENPLLISLLKFDIRFYLLITSIDPIKIYLFNEAMARFATEVYMPPEENNVKNNFIHLTNYSINKMNFKYNLQTNGHKRKFNDILKNLSLQGHDTNKIKEQIKKIMIKTVIAALPYLKQSNTQNNCFQILGVDIMLDDKLKPWLLEINHTPSFKTDSLFDKNLKLNVIKDALQILNIDPELRAKYFKQEIEKNMKKVFAKTVVKLNQNENNQNQQIDQQLGDYEDLSNILSLNILDKLIQFSFDQYNQKYRQNKVILKYNSYTIQKLKQDKCKTEQENRKKILKSYSQKSLNNQNKENPYFQKKKLINSKMKVQQLQGTQMKFDINESQQKIKNMFDPFVENKMQNQIFKYMLKKHYLREIPKNNLNISQQNYDVNIIKKNNTQLQQNNSSLLQTQKSGILSLNQTIKSYSIQKLNYNYSSQQNLLQKYHII